MSSTPGSPTRRRYWCHACADAIVLHADSPELLCPACGSDFLEELESNATDTDPGEADPEGIPPFLANLFRSFGQQQQPQQQGQQSQQTGQSGTGPAPASENTSQGGTGASQPQLPPFLQTLFGNMGWQQPPPPPQEPSAQGQARQQQPGQQPNGAQNGSSGGSYPDILSMLFGVPPLSSYQQQQRQQQEQQQQQQQQQQQSQSSGFSTGGGFIWTPEGFQTFSGPPPFAPPGGGFGAPPNFGGFGGPDMGGFDHQQRNGGFGAPGMGAGGPQSGSAPPVNPFFNILQNLGIHVTSQGVNLGDFAFGQEQFEEIMSRLMEQTGQQPQQPRGVPQEFLDSLPDVEVNEAQVAKHMDCAICQEKYELNEHVTKLECDHLFHATCVKPWLQVSASCPVCRHDVMRLWTPQSRRQNGTAGGNSNGETAAAGVSASTSPPSAQRQSDGDEELPGTWSPEMDPVD